MNGLLGMPKHSLEIHGMFIIINDKYFRYKIQETLFNVGLHVLDRAITVFCLGRFCRARRPAPFW